MIEYGVDGGVGRWEKDKEVEVGGFEAKKGWKKAV